MSKTKRIWSLLTAFAVALFMLPSLSMPIAADDTAADSDYVYTISGYNRSGIITEPDGEVVYDPTFCLDYKQSTPGGGKFRRVKLSEVTTYEKGRYDEAKNFNDDVKRRLLALLIYWDDIRTFMNGMDFTAEQEWLEKNCPGTYDNSEFYVCVHKVFERQTLVWTFEHPESEWEVFLNDDGTSSGHCDIYKWRESKGFSDLYPYVAADPVTDPHSMWNVVFKPIVEYIDSLPDKYAEGWDAWVYFPENNTTQTMLASPFKAVTEGDVYISKTDITGDTELEGAHLQVLDGDTVVEEWDSDTSEHIVTGLTVEKVYTLRETTAPAGYAVTTDTEFVIGADGKVDKAMTTAKTSGSDALLVMDKKIEISVSKVDIASSEEIAGAHIQVLDENEDVVDEWDSTTSAHMIENLIGGNTYTLRETVAPDGYAVTSDTTFEVLADGTVDTSNSTVSVSDTGVLLVEDSKTSVSISKVDVTSSEEIAGAHIQILDGDTVVEEWDSTTSAHTVEGLITGKTYTLRETVAPEGYAITTDTSFALRADGSIDETSTTAATDNNGGILVEDSKTSVSISKVDVTSSEEIAGAHIQILDGDIVVEEWDSTTQAHTVEGLITGKTYTLRETVAPNGYTITTDTTFTLSSDGSIDADNTTSKTDNNTILIEDTKTVVKVSKVDAADSKEIAGAHIQILDGDTVVEEWDSTTTAHTVEGLTAGRTYTLRETVAPEGYAITSDTTFTIAADGKVTSSGTITSDGVILIADGRNTVKIKKTDIDTSAELEGAKLQVLDESGNVIDEWTSGKEAHEVTGLISGITYTLRETSAPEGYTVTSDIKFSVASDGTVTADGKTVSDGVIVVEDSLSDVKIKKVNKYGDALEGAKMQILDANGSAVAEWITDGTIYRVKGLIAGVEYTIHEVQAPEGYALAKDTTFVINSDGTIETEAKTENGVIYIEDLLKLKIDDDTQDANSTPKPAQSDPQSVSVTVTADTTPAPSTPTLTTSVFPDGTKKTPVPNNTTAAAESTAADAAVSDSTAGTSGGPEGTPDERLVTGDTPSNIEEVDSGASVADKGETRSETGVFMIVSVMVIALAVSVLSRKRAK